MTFVAGSCLPGVPDIDRVPEVLPCAKVCELGTLLTSLGDNDVAATTVIGDDSAIITPMSAIVTPHAAFENMVPCVTGVIGPSSFHFRKDVKSKRQFPPLVGLSSWDDSRQVCFGIQRNVASKIGA